MSVLSRSAARLPQLPLPGVTWAVRTWMRRSFGEPPLDPENHAGDAGLYGPGSASWQVIGDAASIVGGIRSLLVQLTHPLAMAGVAQHSRYLEDPLGRLHDTSAYFALVTFGSTAEALGITRRIRAMHSRVVGHAPDGRPYAASDPELLTWVSVGATASFLATDAAFATRPLTAERRDAFVAEQAITAAILDPRVDLTALAARPDPCAALRSGQVPLPLVDEGWLPTTEAELDARMAAFEPVLAVGQQGRQTFEFLLWPPIDPVLRLGYLPALAGALGTLDPVTRRLLGLPHSAPAGALLRLNAEMTLIGLRAALARPSPSAQRAEARAAASPGADDQVRTSTTG